MAYISGDIYGSGHPSAGLPRPRFERLAEAIGNEVAYGEIGMPAFISSRIPSWATQEKKEPMMVPGTPPLPSSLSKSPTETAKAAAAALKPYLGRAVQLHGRRVYAQVNGPVWPQALQAAAKVANAENVVMLVTVSDTDLPMTGIVGLTLEFVPFGR